MAIDDLCGSIVAKSGQSALRGQTNEPVGFWLNTVSGSKRGKSLQAADEWFISCSCFGLVYLSATGFLSQSQCLAIQTKVITPDKVVDHCSVYHCSQYREAVPSSDSYLEKHSM